MFCQSHWYPDQCPAARIAEVTVHGETNASGGLDRSSTGRTTLILGDDRLEDVNSAEFDAFNKHWDQPLHKAIFPLQHQWVDKDIRHHVKTWMGRRMEMNDVETIDPEMTDLYTAALDEDGKLVKLIDKLDYQKNNHDQYKAKLDATVKSMVELQRANYPNTDDSNIEYKTKILKINQWRDAKLQEHQKVMADHQSMIDAQQKRLDDIVDRMVGIARHQSKKTMHPSTEPSCADPMMTELIAHLDEVGGFKPSYKII